MTDTEQNFFDLFDCGELERGNPWDGHTEEDVTRLLSSDQEPCEDCISRKSALEPYQTLDDRDTISVWLIRNNIEQMPSVTPQPKIGHWMIIDDCEQFIAKCSECGRIEDSRLINNYPYCHCGARMQEAKRN